MTTREQPYATYEEVEVVVCDRCGDECPPPDATEYHVGPEPTFSGRSSTLYTRHWSLDNTPRFEEATEVDSDATLELCPECDAKYARRSDSLLSRFRARLSSILP